MSTDLVIETAALPGQPSGTIAVYVHEGQPPDGAGGAIWAATGLDWARAAGAASFTGKQGQALDLPAPAGLEADRLLVLGAGKPPAPGETNLTAFADRGGSLMAKLGRAEKAFVLLDGPEFRPEAVAEVVAGLRLRHYRFDKYKARKDDDNEPKTQAITLLVADKDAADAAIAGRAASVDGALLARDLINEPANVLGPVELAAEIEKLADRGLIVEILTDADMQKLGMNSLLAVGRGSRRPARLGVIQWRGGKPEAAPLAFIGKGVCFDTGGISIKQANGMEDMKGDMAGAAAVIGLLSALAVRQAPVNAVGVVGLVENMPDGNALRPGDILKAMSGTTIEVNNTDAEGRLVLADALWYTQDRFKPAFMVNLATLTGAIIMSLGNDFAGLFSNNDELASRLYAAGIASGEKLWRMPMAPAYEKLLDSRFADIKNTGGRPGAIFAAHFLQRFVNNVPWAHLDIAGTAFGGPSTETNAGWASGFGVALLDRLVRDFYEA